ncbi:MAG: hypothetical protein [Caudoviricetes sp.]|nr:MAG: hypothetical protein [Caudoviricetes sp.]
MTEKTVVKKYHWLISAQLVFVLPEQKEGSVITMNTMLLTDEPVVNYKDLARANHTLKVSIDQRFETPVELKDIVILAASNLGLMSEPEFKAGMVPEEA